MPVLAKGPDSGSINAILMFSANAALAPMMSESAETAPIFVIFFMLFLPRTARRCFAIFIYWAILRELHTPTVSQALTLMRRRCFREVTLGNFEKFTVHIVSLSKIILLKILF